MQSIKVSIKQQLDVNKSRNLLFENITQIMNVEPSFLAALEELLNSNLSDQSADAYEDVVSFTAKELVKRLHSINPYLQVGQAHVEDLEQIYRQTWQIIKETRDIKTTLNEFHYPELSKWLTTLYPENLQSLRKSSASVSPLTYAEYSAELQVELFGIDTAQIKQPVIDIGCGSQANLVRYFRSVGIEAYGVDRHLQICQPYLHQLEWFDFYFEPGKWGTIVSNMAFTNHLNYAYRHDISQLEGYLAKMKEILESLSIGGYFRYAPSLPFVEDKLSSARYRVEREQKIRDVSVTVINRVV
jgi:hypothetical protein